MKSNEKRARRKFTPEFKSQAVKRVLSGRGRPNSDTVGSTPLWSDGDRHVLVDYRIYDKAGDALTKNDHFRAMLEVAHGRGFMPEYVVFDSWYSGLDNFKQVRDLGWTWLTRLKTNRLVNPEM